MKNQLFDVVSVDARSMAIFGGSTVVPSTGYDMSVQSGAVRIAGVTEAAFAASGAFAGASTLTAATHTATQLAWLAPSANPAARHRRAHAMSVVESRYREKSRYR